MTSFIAQAQSSYASSYRASSDPHCLTPLSPSVGTVSARALILLYHVRCFVKRIPNMQFLSVTESTPTLQL
ncbi:hypothetical protein M408DRAFT_327225 [Serendipita vermifera MAFF 305830]|uniref:Uncharacterized protein n=1 Tax=Serendipita vermifera MAFF 305830 TaxID=933852 RepID=A0A0C3BJZ2_SERVB|nr:hypothetical protein M408DRAFT_327225 [Serendipita vermifera MAFF 305830]